MQKITKIPKTIGLVLLAFTILVTGMAIVTPKQPQPPVAIANVTELETYLEKLVDFGDPPGMSLVVVKNGQVVYSHAYGLADGPRGVPASPETIYHWWSVTKLFTATAIFQLQEQGKLNIDDAVTQYLPYFDVKYPTPASSPITIRHLLNHSSGLPDNIPAVLGWMHLESEASFNQTAFLQQKLPDYAKLAFEPGAQSVYTNVGYMALGAVIEKVSGQAYDDYVVEHILQPLAMDHTNFIYTDAMLPRAAVGMHPLVDFQTVFLPFFYGNRLPSFIREISGGRMWFNRIYADSTPPTGLIGPATDLARFAAATLNSGELDGQRILSPKSIATMLHENYLPASGPQTSYPLQGLGWEVCGQGPRLCLTHGGGGPGFGAAIRIYPDEALGIALTANSTKVNREAILNLLASLDW
jgi:D-alanyl-D-alanine carboxypeptidase